MTSLIHSDVTHSRSL